MMAKTVSLEVKVCPKCKYEWISRVNKPKECPRCKAYLYYDEEEEAKG